MKTNDLTNDSPANYHRIELEVKGYIPACGPSIFFRVFTGHLGDYDMEHDTALVAIDVHLVSCEHLMGWSSLRAWRH